MWPDIYNRIASIILAVVLFLPAMIVIILMVGVMYIYFALLLIYNTLMKIKDHLLVRYFSISNR